MGAVVAKLSVLNNSGSGRLEIEICNFSGFARPIEVKNDIKASDLSVNPISTLFGLNLYFTSRHV